MFMCADPKQQRLLKAYEGGIDTRDLFTPTPVSSKVGSHDATLESGPRSRDKPETELPPEVQELVQMARNAMQRPMYGRLGMAAGQPWARKVGILHQARKFFLGSQFSASALPCLVLQSRDRSSASKST